MTCARQRSAARSISFALVFWVTLIACAADRAATPAQPEPAYERRDQPAEVSDLRILERADALLAREGVWNRADDRNCPDAATSWSLFCALHQACIDVLGRYEHRKLALQEVRFAVEDATRGRNFDHRLMRFNNLPETTFDDVKRVLRTARERVRARLQVQAER